MEPPITDAELAAIAKLPASTTTGGITTVERPLDELGDAAERLARRQALGSGNSNGGRLGGWGAAIKERVQPPG